MTEIIKDQAAREYDLRVFFLDIPIFDMKFDEIWYDNLWDGPEFIEKTKQIVASMIDYKLAKADQWKKLTQEDLDTLKLVELMRQKFRQWVHEWKVKPWETARKYFQRNLTVKFLL